MLDFLIFLNGVLVSAVALISYYHIIMLKKVTDKFSLVLREFEELHNNSAKNLIAVDKRLSELNLSVTGIEHKMNLTKKSF